MVKRKKKKSVFAGKTATTAAKQVNQGANYGYVNLPKDVNMFSINSKRVYVDIIPYIITDEKHMDKDEENQIAMVGDPWYKKPFRIHRGIGIESDSVVCLSTFGKKCPICEYRAQRIKAGADRDETDALKPSLRNLYFVKPKNNKKFEDELYIWDVSEFLFQKLLNEELIENEDYEVFPDLEEGLTLKIRSEEKTFDKNKYYSTSRIDFEERDEQYRENYLEEIPNLDEVLVELSYEKLSAKFFEEDTEDEEEDEKPRRKKTSTKKKKVDEEEDEDEELEEIEDVEDEDLEDDDDEDEDVDEDEDEDEAPKRKPAKQKRKAAKKSTSKSKCPHGHVFGEDADEYDECEECEKWDDCVEASEE